MRKQNLILGLCCLSLMSIAQDKWDADGNLGVGNNAKIGPKNNKGFSIITNNQAAVNVANDGVFNFIKPVNFTNKVKFDSLRVIKYLEVDSIHCRTIKVGHSWTVNDAGPAYFGTRPYNQQLQNASNNVHTFEGGAFGNPSLASRDNIKTIVGYLNSPNGPQHKFVAHSNFNNDVFAAFTNINSYGVPTSYVATDGFKVGILANGVAQINQQENLDMQFLTNNTQRMVIKNAGRVGIGLNAPANRLEIASAAGDPGFASANGSSGLKFSNLNNSNTPIANPSNKVLSVDNAGNVILVPDSGGSGPGAVTAQNGLNTLAGPNIVELGGNLIHHTDVTTNNTGGTPFDMVFSGNGQFGMGEGLAAGFLNPDAKINANNTTKLITMQVENNHGTTPTFLNNEAGHFVTKGTNTGWFNVGIYGEAQNSSVYNIGGIFSGASSAGSTNFGIAAYASNAPANIGITAQVSGTTNDLSNEGIIISTSLGQSVYGINSTATGDAQTTDLIGISSAISSGASNNPIKSISIAGINNSQSISTKYGVQGITDGANTTGNVAVSGIVGFNGYYTGSINHPVTGNPANVGVYGGFAGSNPIFAKNLPDNLAGYFDGDVYIGGGFNITSGGFALTSDSQFKTNIHPLVSTKAIIDQLQPKTFYFDTTNTYNIKFDHKKQYGLIAQDVEQILPELVSAKTKYAKKDSIGNIIEAGTTYKALNYNAFIGILLANAKEQNTRIDSLIAALNSSSLRQGAPTPNTNGAQQVNNVNLQSVTLSNADAIVLDQNQPNPFSESTVIKYNVPEKYGYAQLIFTTNEGRILKTMDIAKKGAGEITVYAADLSNGIYTYTLVVDGKTIDSKKMIKE